MISSSARFEALRNEFERAGIPLDSPGFYDHPAYARAYGKGDGGKNGPDFMTPYARFVLWRPYGEAYLARAEKTVRTVGDVLHAELVKDGRLGACVDMGMVFSRILDKLGVWNFMVNGAVTTIHPAESGILNGYYWPLHNDAGTDAGHAWITAPPFRVVDLTLGMQPDHFQTSRYVPETVYSRETSDFPVDIDDVCDEAVRAELHERGIPMTRAGLFQAYPRLEVFFEDFPGTLVPYRDAEHRYVPVSILESVGPLEENEDLCLNGKFGRRLWEEEVRPLFA